MERLVLSLVAFPKVLVAAVNGVASGLGHKYCLNYSDICRIFVAQKHIDLITNVRIFHFLVMKIMFQDMILFLLGLALLPLCDIVYASDTACFNSFSSRYVTELVVTQVVCKQLSIFRSATKLLNAIVG